MRVWQMRRMPSMHMELSRPVSPNEQLVTIESNAAATPAPNTPGKHLALGTNDGYDDDPNNYERYYFYVEQGVNAAMIAPLSHNQFEQFGKLLATHLKESKHTHALMELLADEIHADYTWSMKKTIVDYVLMSEDERHRLKIKWIPKKFMLKYKLITTHTNP